MKRSEQKRTPRDGDNEARGGSGVIMVAQQQGSTIRRGGEERRRWEECRVHQPVGRGIPPNRLRLTTKASAAVPKIFIGEMIWKRPRWSTCTVGAGFHGAAVVDVADARSEATHSCRPAQEGSVAGPRKKVGGE